MKNENLEILSQSDPEEDPIYEELEKIIFSITNGRSEIEVANFRERVSFFFSEMGLKYPNLPLDKFLYSRLLSVGSPDNEPIALDLPHQEIETFIRREKEYWELCDVVTEKTTKALEDETVIDFMDKKIVFQNKMMEQYPEVSPFSLQYFHVLIGSSEMKKELDYPENEIENYIREEL